MRPSLMLSMLMAPGSETRDWYDGAGYAELPADVDYIVDGSWGGFQEPDHH